MAIKKMINDLSPMPGPFKILCLSDAERQERIKTLSEITKLHLEITPL